MISFFWMSCFRNMTVLKCVSRSGNIRMFRSLCLQQKGDDMDKILGLEYGADDYITKPFNILEVKARIKKPLCAVSASAIKIRKMKSDRKKAR